MTSKQRLYEEFAEHLACGAAAMNSDLAERIMYALRRFPDETAEQPPYPQVITDRLRQIANLIESRPVLGHWPAMMAEPDARFLRSLSDALAEPRLPVHPLLASSVETTAPRAHKWDAEGERCTICGDKDWMGTTCNGPPVKASGESP